MTDFVSQPTTIQAEQWTGDAASLLAIQRLIAPLSPYRCTFSSDLAAPGKSLGVCVVHGSVPTMAWCEVGSWVVRAGDRLTVLTDAEFRASYRSVLERHPIGIALRNAATAVDDHETGEGLRDA